MRCLLNELQHPDECRMFCELLVRENVRSYLEIGSRHGGSLWAVGLALGPGSRLVSVEVSVTQDLRQCADALRSRGLDVVIVEGDSTDPRTVETTRALGPFDAVLIDGRHESQYVRADWSNYGPMGRLVAFHDARGGTPTEKKPWKRDVRILLDEIAQTRDVEMIKVPGGIGFGVVR